MGLGGLKRYPIVVNYPYVNSSVPGTVQLAELPAPAEACQTCLSSRSFLGDGWASDSLAES